MQYLAAPFITEHSSIAGKTMPTTALQKRQVLEHAGRVSGLPPSPWAPYGPLGVFLGKQKGEK